MATSIYQDSEKDVQQEREIVNNSKNPSYAAQYKFLAKRSQLRVWVEKDKYEKLKKAVKQNGTSIYKLINDFVDAYLNKTDIV